MTTFRKIALAFIALAVVAPAATGETDYERAQRDYESALKLGGQLCVKGKIEERLDCLGRELFALKESIKPRLHPLGLPATQ